MNKLKVLFHINENEKWNVALGNIASLISDVGEENTEVIVVANGFAVYGYTDSEKLSVIEQLTAGGVKFIACRYSLTSMCQDGVACVREDVLPSFIAIVPAGITEIIERQQDGFAYIKP